MTTAEPRLWRRPEAVAAIVNAVLVLLIPLAFILLASIASHADSAVRARVSSPLEYTMARLVDLAIVVGPFVPLASLAGWRTWVHAERFRDGRGKGWQGVVEAGALGLLLALAVLARGIWMRPADAPPYVIVYGGGALLLGLAIGFVLRIASLLVLKLYVRPEPRAVSP